MREQRVKINHYCNQVIDPATCCPVAHGAPEDQCDRRKCVTESVQEKCDLGHWHEIERRLRNHDN